MITVATLIPEVLRAGGIAPLPPRPNKRPFDGGDANWEGAGPSNPKRARGDIEDGRGVKAEESDGEDEEDEEEDRAVFLQVSRVLHSDSASLVTGFASGANCDAAEPACPSSSQEN